MAIKYESVVPWGRSYEEYLKMFALEEADLRKTILGCGDGPASFNRAMTEKGRKVISVDPIYEFNAEQLRERIKATYDTVIEQTRQNKDKFVWTNIRDVHELGEIRMTAMTAFLEDYEKGKKEGRYICAMLPTLPFEEEQFELALSSHFLFLYSDNLSLDFHIQAIDEMLRVAQEVRVFPILDANAKRSDYVDEVIKRYSGFGHMIEEVLVDYEFQCGGNKMLKIAKKL